MLDTRLLLLSSYSINMKVRHVEHGEFHALVRGLTPELLLPSGCVVRDVKRDNSQLILFSPHSTAAT